MQEQGFVTCEKNFDFNRYALVTNPVVSPPKCNALSTSSISSIKQDTFTDAQGKEHLAVKYENDNGCSLKVGLICNKDQAEFSYSPLVEVS